MKIYYIHNCRMPTEKAHGYQIMKTCEALAMQGVEVRLFVTDRSTPIKTTPFEYYDVREIFRINYLKVFDTLAYCKNTFSQASYLIELLSFFSSIKKINFKEADVLYTRDPWLAPKLKKLTDKPTFLELHAMPREKTIRKLKTLDGIFCVTKWMCNEIQKRIPNLRVEFLPDSVDLEVFDIKITREQARAELKLDPNAFIVAYGGKFSTMEQGKGLKILDDAVSELTKAIPKIQLLLIGGDKEDFITTEKHEPGTATTCIPHVKRNVLAKYYKAADVLVMPFPNTHHYAYEMSPLKLFEYMASGTPIITSDLPSIREILDEKKAIFFNLEEPESLRLSILKALKKNIETNSLAQLSKNSVQEFTWKNRAKKIIDSAGS